MADIAQQLYATAPRTAGVGGGANNQPQCTFSKALDEVHFLRNLALAVTLTIFL